MDKRTIFVVLAAVLAVNALERGEGGVDNPIIEFFEAPVRAFKTKVAEDVEPISSPEGKSVGIAKVNNNSWFRGKGLANWLMSRNAVTTTTTSLPEVVLNTPGQNIQQFANNNRNSPNRRRVVNRSNFRKGAIQNRNWNVRRNANNRRRVQQIPTEDDVIYSDEDDYEDGGRRYQFAYENVPYSSASYEDEEDDEPVPYVPVKNHGLRRGQAAKKNQRPNSSYLQPFQDIPIQARPVRLRQNLPATKPIGNKQTQTQVQGQLQVVNKPNQMNNPNRQQLNNKNKKKKNNRGKPGVNVDKNNVNPVHFIVHPQGNGQLPVLIPVNANNNNRKKNKVQNQNHNIMNDPSDYPNYPNYQNYQYIPIPVQALGQQGFKGIPQIQVIAQHTHTFRPHHGGYPTEVILGPGFDNVLMEQPAAEGNKKKPNKNNNMNHAHNNQNQKIVAASEDTFKKEKPLSMEDLMQDPTKQTIVVEELTEPETTLETQASSGEGMVELAVGDEDKENEPEMRSSESRQHILIPRHLFPIFGASSLVEVANNGKFLLKTGRNLKVSDNDHENPAKIVEKVKSDAKEAVVVEGVKKVDGKSDTEHTIIKKDEVVLPNSAEIASTTELSQSPNAPKDEDKKQPAEEKPASPKLPIRPEQLHDIPVAIVHEEPAARHVSKAGKSVEHGNHHKFRSEIVHESPNGHFIVKSGAAAVPEAKSNVGISDSEVKTIKLIPAVHENSKAT